MKTLIEKILKIFYPVFRQWLHYEIYAYLAVGAANTALNIILFTVFYKLILGNDIYTLFSFPFASYTIALILAFVLTVPTGFWLSKSFAFTNAIKQKTSKQLGKYFLVVFQGVITDYLLFKVLIIFVHLDPVVAKILSTAIVLIINYVLQKFYTFKPVKPLL